MNATEALDPRYADIDRLPTREAVDAMLSGQMEAIAAIGPVAGAIAEAADAIAARLKAGGRLIYAGAGTSARVAVQDGVELWPTFGWPQDQTAYVIAGGLEALTKAVEGAEDDEKAAEAQVSALLLTANDVMIGVAASGRTPFTLAAIRFAQAAGALTIGVSNNADAPLCDAAEHAITVITGSELVAGSTRMKAGTAQKVVLNLLSTAAMLRLGRVYRGMMVDMIISNDKLRLRGQAMVRELTGCDEAESITLLNGAGNDVKKAVLMAKGLSKDAATDLLGKFDHNLRFALEHLNADADV